MDVCKKLEINAVRFSLRIEKTFSKYFIFSPVNEKRRELGSFQDFAKKNSTWLMITPLFLMWSYIDTRGQMKKKPK